MLVCQIAIVDTITVLCGALYLTRVLIDTVASHDTCPMFADISSAETFLFIGRVDIRYQRVAITNIVGCPGNLITDLNVFGPPTSIAMRPKVQHFIGQLSMKSTENIQYISNVHTECSSFNPCVVTSIMYLIC